MALGTFSKFYYGFEVTASNNKIDFDDGPTLAATIPTGFYTPTDLALEIKEQMDAVSSQTYTVTFNRSTRKYTIAVGAGTFDLLINTGANAATGIYDLIGFTGSSDLTATATYTGDSEAGSEYKPQFWLQDYTSPTEWYERSDASFAVTASGDVEMVSFGQLQFTEFSVMFITNLEMDGVVIKNNPSGVSNANSFMQYAIKKAPIEFMPDESTPATYYKIILEQTPESGIGVGYKLKEETGKNLPGFYTTGVLKWRVI